MLEAHLLDVLDPATAGESIRAMAAQLGLPIASPQRLLELSRGLSIRVGSKVKQTVNLSTGEAQIGFEETHDGTDGAPLKIPGAFVVGIPVFRNGALYQMLVRLRYRVSGGSVVWFFAPQHADRIWDDAITGACAGAQEKTELPLFYGTPEA